MPTLKYRDPITGNFVRVNGSGDKNYAQPFVTSSEVVVTHNLGKYPAITVVDSAYSEVIGEVVHNNTMQATVTFSASFSGVVYCN